MSFAQVIIPVKDFSSELSFFQELGFRLDRIYPDDDPQMAEMSGFGIAIRLDRNIDSNPPILQIKTDGDKMDTTSPNGCQIQYIPLNYEIVQPPAVHSFEVRKLQDEDPWVIGRAGMHYRDLLPSRLGGGIMASHIRIPVGGPVPDMVHFHTIGFQLIFCYKGWVRLVYEDQGEPFILKAGDCVNQPPEIRHRVLEASDNLEVIEIGIPAAHMTTIDHEMELPTDTFNPEREFQGQKFVRFQSENASWEPWLFEELVASDTGIAFATKNVASVNVIKSNKTISETEPKSHSSDIFFCFVMNGSVEVEVGGQDEAVRIGEAFVIPPENNFKFLNCSEDLEILNLST